MKRGVAAVTMAYNEPVFLPLWANYYGSQFGNDHCYVVDHGSDDGSTEGLAGINVVRIPRSPMHDGKRANFISNFVSALLEWYDTVIYTDVDEILIPDPNEFRSLSDFCWRSDLPVVTAIGLDVYQMPHEKPIDLSKNLTLKDSLSNFVVRFFL